MNKEVLMVKIYNKKYDMYCTKSNRWNKYGKMYRKLSHAKLHINDNCWENYLDWINCDFIIFYSNGETEKIPCIEYVLDLFEREYKRYSKKEYLKDWANSYLQRINEIKQILEGNKK